MMLSPSPVPLLCALVLCFPLAVVFTVTTTTITTSAREASLGGGIPNGYPLQQEFTSVTQRTTASPYRSSPEVSVEEISYSVVADSEALPLPPPPLPVNYDDEEDNVLFRAASRVKPRPRIPRKLAFMFLAKGGLPLAPLWEVYFNNTPKALYNIYIHADPMTKKKTRPQFTGVFEGRGIPSKPTRRHTPMLISAARRLLSRALLDDPGNAMFVLLSPSCIPLRSFNFTYATLTRSKTSFVEVLRNEAGSHGRWAARGEEAMLPEVRLEDFRIGSQFWAMTRKHARLVVGDTRVWSKFVLPCLRLDTCYPEENYFPTLLSMSDPRGIVPATLTHVDWRGRHNGHPRTYFAAEVRPELVIRLRTDRPRYGDLGMGPAPGLRYGHHHRHHPFLFARKFSAAALAPLMSIANEVLFKD